MKKNKYKKMSEKDEKTFNDFYSSIINDQYLDTKYLLFKKEIREEIEMSDRIENNKGE